MSPQDFFLEFEIEILVCHAGLCKVDIVGTDLVQSLKNW